MNEEKVKIDKVKIITNAITISISVIIVTVFLGALGMVLYPILTGEKDNNSTLSTTQTDLSIYLDRIKEAMNKIYANHIDELNLDELTDGAISGMAAATGDPYTRFVSQEEYHDMLVSGTEVYSGIGIHLTYHKETQGIIVIGVMPGSPAQQADLKPGDIIGQVDDILVNVDTYSTAVDAIKGKEGTTVKLIIKRGEDFLVKDVVRKQIATNNIDAQKLDSNIGYIKIWAFENDIDKQFRTEYEKLKNQNIKGLIIDLRNNPGGLVPATVNIANMLLPEGEVVKLVYKNGSQKVYKSDSKEQIDIPLVVLVNGRSASASEILAGAIKDSKKGIIIGTTTYGKGIVQTIEPIKSGKENRGALSITTSKYYTASGVEIHKNGIEPNLVVELPEEVKSDITIPTNKDTQLQKAIEYINAQ